MPHLRTRNHRIIENAQGEYLGVAAENFLVDRKAAGRTRATVKSYGIHLSHFIDYCDAHQLRELRELTADFLRRYLLALAETHNPGGVHIFYRTLRAFLRWVEFEEVMPPEWRNPIHKIHAPKVPEILQDPVPLEDVSAILAACSSPRDRALFLVLLDTGARAKELCRMDQEHVDLAAGSIAIPQAKSGRPRLVYIGRKSRRAIRAMLRGRRDHSPALFVTQDLDRLTYSGLREIVRRRARDAGIPEPTLHQFRRAFALNYLRAGGDLFTLQRIMGHSDLSVLRKYLKLTDQDAQIAHGRFSPVDRL